MRALLPLLLLGCAGGELVAPSADASAADATRADGTLDRGLPPREAGLPPADATPSAELGSTDATTPIDDAAQILDAVGPEPDAKSCPAEGPAYLHGDLWAYWYNFRVACDGPHKWWWICEQRQPGQCQIEQAWFEDCWNARGAWPQTSWGEDSHPAPHSANYGVCQPQHWGDKNGEGRRPANPVPCDTTTHDYDRLRTEDPFAGVDWWAGATGMRHLTIKLFEAGANPLASEGHADGVVALSTHPGDRDALMGDLQNHGPPGGRVGCVHRPDEDREAPGLGQSFGAFAWLEVPTGRPMQVAANWNELVAGNINLGCIQGLYFFPPQFAEHSVEGKPWFTSSPCFDVQQITFEPGRHYLWDLHGLRALPGCSGPPESVLVGVPEGLREGYRSGACAAP